MADAAARRLGAARPRVAVAGLNPHAGEGGLFGDEELRVIAPAVAGGARGGHRRAAARSRPTPSSCARAMPPAIPASSTSSSRWYHDHGLIPVKYLGVERGVNVTLGLPFVRTSPDHGTAFDIAGTGTADPSSFAAAARLARRLAGDRAVSACVGAPSAASCFLARPSRAP